MVSIKLNTDKMKYENDNPYWEEQVASNTNASNKAATSTYPSNVYDPWKVDKFSAEKEKIARDVANVEYQNRLRQSMVRPEELTKSYDTYKGAQTKTAADYAGLMEKNITQNLADMKAVQDRADAAQLAYQNRIAPQYGAISDAQASVSRSVSDAQSRYAAEQSAATDYFNQNIAGRFTAAMDKAAAEYAATRAQVQAKMDATDVYYQNQIKPQYARLMEGGLSLRDASDPSNYVSTGVQSAYQKLVDKSALEAQQLAQRTKASGQADYGVLAALGNQARGLQAQPMTGAQQQLAQAATTNQASLAFQNAMNRVADIENQQRLYAQQTRETGLQAGMEQAWKNYQNYQASTGLAQQADIANYQAMLAGTKQLGDLTSQAAATQFTGSEGLGRARSTLSGDIANLIRGGMEAATSGASQINALANTYGQMAGQEMANAQWATGLQQALAEDSFMKRNIVPEFKYNTASGFNTGDYNVDLGAADLRARNASTLAGLEFAQKMNEANITTQNREAEAALQRNKWAIEQGIAAQEAAAQAQSDASWWSSLGQLGGAALGGIGGFILGGPAGGLMGASLGGSLGGDLSNIASGGSPYYTGQNNLGTGINSAANIYNNMVKNQRPTYGGVGVSPMMNNYTLGIDPSLYRVPNVYGGT